MHQLNVLTNLTTLIYNIHFCTVAYITCVSISVTVFCHDRYQCHSVAL